MKICEYCGTPCKTSDRVCPSCGANAFAYKCENCATVFHTGAYCPSCGVKADAVAKKCPRCGNKYFSFACPDCGYTAASKRTDATSIPRNPSPADAPAPQPYTRRKTWLWVLGWIFIFPLPLTILMVRNQKLEKALKSVIIVAAWILYYLIMIRN